MMQLFWSYKNGLIPIELGVSWVFWILGFVMTLRWGAILHPHPHLFCKMDKLVEEVKHWYTHGIVTSYTASIETHDGDG